MNKNAIYGLGAVLGLAAVAALFYGTRPSDSSVVDVDPTTLPSHGPLTAEMGTPELDPTIKKKDPEASPGVNPFAAKAAARQERDYNKFSAKAAPTWQGIGMELHNSDPELAERARTMAQTLRSLNNEEEVDTAAVLAEQSALLEEVRALGAGEGVTKGIDRLDGLIAALESGEEMP